MTVRLVSDTACDLPVELADDLGIVLVPFHIRFGNTELVDREQLGTRGILGAVLEFCRAPRDSGTFSRRFPDGIRIRGFERSRWRGMRDSVVEALGYQRGGRSSGAGVGR